MSDSTEITIIEDNSGSDTPVVRDRHPANPYNANFPSQAHAWQDGYEAYNTDTLSDDEPANPFDPVDAITDNRCWNEGYQYAAYVAAPFNPTDLWRGVFFEGQYEEWESFRRFAVNVSMLRHTNPVSKLPEWRIVWAWGHGDMHADHKPAWADNRIEDRSILLSKQEASNFVKRNVTAELVGAGGIDLPCPPYTYTYEEGGMSIEAGAFRKWGSKDDWERVVGEMQEQIESMPEGVDIEDAHIYVDVLVTTNTSIRVPIRDLVNHDSGLVYAGTMDELESEVEEAVRNVRDWDDYADQIEFSYLDFSVEFLDVPESIEDAREL